jgi:hypothetical protein
MDGKMALSLRNVHARALLLSFTLGKAKELMK